MEKIECEFCGISINTLPEWKEHHLAVHKTYSPWVPLYETIGKDLEQKLNTALSESLP